jgi:O-antigen ligase
MIPFFLLFKEKILSGKERWLYYAILCYIVSLYIKHIPVVTNVLMLGIFIFSCVISFGKNYMQLIKNNRVIFGIALFFICQLISAFFSTNFQAGANVLLMRLPLFILPLAFCFINFELKIWNRITLFYAFITAIASVIGFAYGVYSAINKHDTGYLYNDNISELLLDKQAVYFGFYVNAAILMLIFSLKSIGELSKQFTYLAWVSLLWLIFIIFMLASKTSMLCLAAILFFVIVRHVFTSKNKMEGGLLLLSIVIGAVLVMKMFPKTLNRFKGITETSFVFDNKNRENHFNAEYEKDKWNSTNTRVALWQCGAEIWHEHFLFGTGIGDKKEALIKKYNEKHFWYAIDTEKNLHNQYLDILASMGLVGLLFFVFCFFVYPLIVFIRNGQLFSILLFCCLAFCFFTENMLDRFQGEIIISFILPLAAKISNRANGTMLRDFPSNTSQ